MRGFFGFGIDPSFSLELRSLADTFPAEAGLRLAPATDYHVTIKFLSEFSSTDFFACLPQLCELGKPPVSSLRAGKLALWPTVLALECQPSEELSAWHGKVNAFLERKGFIHERHPRFHPHITIARRKPDARIPKTEAYLSGVEEKFSGRSIALEAPALWQSQAEETGRRHRPLLSPLFS